MLWGIGAVLVAIWVAGITIWLLLERRSPQATLAWIFGLALLPGIGIPVYLLLGPRRLERRKLRLADAREVVAKAAASAAWEVASPARERYRKLTEMAKATSGIGPSLAREVEIYWDGASCFAGLEAAIRGAEHHVHLEYYIWEKGLVGDRLLTLLEEKARAGVEVRLLVDGIGSKALPRRHVAPLIRAGGEFARFNHPRFARFRPRFVNFRTHRKIVVVDGRVGFTGGMNIVDYHSEEVAGDKAWRDTHLRLTGPAVMCLQTVFLENWHFANGDGPTSADYFPVDPEQGTHVVQIVSSGPDDDTYGIHKVFFSSISGAKKQVYITTPYFVPDDPMLTALSTAALRGADVRVIVPEVNDSKLVAAASRSYYAELLRSGVRIFEYGERMLHAKTLSVDGLLGVIGTANMDNRSFRLNFEVVACLFEKSQAESLAARFEEDLTASREITLEELRSAGFFRRLTEGFARLFSPLL